GYPIYTSEAQCQDCYKCVRRCPVKAIRVHAEHAMVLPELCVACGGCVEVCPAHAKKVRSDMGRLHHLLDRGRAVYVSLAPSWVSEFEGIKPGQMVAALRRLGFAGVSETALGAQAVSAALARDFKAGTAHGAVISSACPVVVDFIQKYLPELSPGITKLHSPLLAHTKILRGAFGDSIAVVFFGPCIAKKNEADSHPDLLNLALTFRDLHELFERERIDPASLSPGAEDRFVPHAAQEGALYPIERGMIRTIETLGVKNEAGFVTVSGLNALHRALKGLELDPNHPPVFIEALACEGGCVNGPCTAVKNSTLMRRLRIEEAADIPDSITDRPSEPDITQAYPPAPVTEKIYSEEEMIEALSSIGKVSARDELNCAGCGYGTCREFASALLSGRSEPAMCVSHMRKQALKKANILLRRMPSGVVIVDENLRIVECNERFAKMFGERTMEIYEVCAGLKGCMLEKVVPLGDMIRTALRTGQEIHYDHYRIGRRLLNITLFALEPRKIVGAILLDVTTQELQRDQIAQRAQEVIKRNLSTVQEIACRLGEHMAETEILLRSIAEGYGSDADVSQIGPSPLLPESSHESE
ncbi:MAG TPA: [Fe-Fe] hydrogenase large subunit C-terminal domain-containing protein, partial [Acidobacteriota bacterium]|nr:[Fe-Fe] hydrogenase large subunit C-terminal domain-containing protein [Acidobacteriota bacterium]